ncbi:hypothetical protein CPT_Shady_052 [Streptomyces phage Shady]|uniref:Uncharacterized protein n=1 Tax=Streptomyces phage Shady TaxID=2767585 RepID=A0A873WHI0_9CAUD|nr:hypothetical protein CPT_Shady_052 [Streptomyces phage Shady]
MRPPADWSGVSSCVGYVIRMKSPGNVTRWGWRVLLFSCRRGNKPEGHDERQEHDRPT